MFDLDGVIRHWNDDALDLSAVRHGLAPRTILDVAFSPELGRAAITGRLSHREWMDRVRTEVIGIHGEGCVQALDEWEANVGTVDTQMVELLRQVRSQVPVALLSNGTTRLRRDLVVLDLLDEFDVVFNTAEIGTAKPDVRVFEYVIADLGTVAARTAFVDDLEQNVDGATSAGLTAHHFLGYAPLAEFLEQLGLEVERA